jgi:hypothetical protein
MHLLYKRGQYRPWKSLGAVVGLALQIAFHCSVSSLRGEHDDDHRQAGHDR